MISFPCRLPPKLADYNRLKKAFDALLDCVGREDFFSFDSKTEGEGKDKSCSYSLSPRAQTNVKDLAVRLQKLGEALGKAGVTWHWETATGTESEAKQLLEMRNRANANWVWLLTSRRAHEKARWGLVCQHIGRFRDKLLGAIRPKGTAGRPLEYPHSIKLAKRLHTQRHPPSWKEILTKCKQKYPQEKTPSLEKVKNFARVVNRAIRKS